MFADFFVVLISNHFFELYQGLGTSCDVTAGDLRNDVVEGGGGIGSAEYTHVTRRGASKKQTIQYQINDDFEFHSNIVSKTTTVCFCKTLLAK